MKTINWILENWDALCAIGAIVLGIAIKLKNLWTGNVKEWLINICLEMEKEFGEKTGLIKKSNAYAIFVEQYPIISKLISAKTFDKILNEALEIIHQEIENNEKVKEYCGK